MHIYKPLKQHTTCLIRNASGCLGKSIEPLIIIQSSANTSNPRSSKLNGPVNINPDPLNMIRPPPKPRLCPDCNDISQLQIPDEPPVARVLASALIKGELLSRLCVGLDVVCPRPSHNVVLPLPMRSQVALDGPFILAEQGMRVLELALVVFFLGYDGGVERA